MQEYLGRSHKQSGIIDCLLEMVPQDRAFCNLAFSFELCCYELSTKMLELQQYM